MAFVAPPFDDLQVAVYLLIGAPSFAGLPKLTFRVVLFVAERIGFVGARGAPTVTGADDADGVPGDPSLYAVTRHRYVPRVVTPVTVIAAAVPP